MSSKIVAVAAAAAVAAGIVGGLSAASAPAEAPPPPAAPTTVGPGEFDPPRQTEYFPRAPGTMSRFRGPERGDRYVERVLVTHRTKRIQGVATTVVRDVLRRDDGSLAEKTFDWYAPDSDGNVWYFGEATATFDRHGNLRSRDGSWEAGARGAVAGLIMPANPRPTDSYRQEFFAGHAEDQAWIVERHASTTVPYGTLHHLVRSFEWTRLEKQVLSLKLYAPGLGIVREKDMSGGDESFLLVSVERRHG